MVDNIASGSPSTGGHDLPTPQHVKDQAAHVGQSAVHAGGEMVDSVKEQGKEVAAEAGRQARDLYRQVTSEVGEQAGAQKRRAVDGLYALGDEVTKMADHAGTSGPATQVARQAADRINQAAQWLEHREPGHVLDEVKDFARRRPGAFLVGAAVLGILAGRLTKNLASGTDSDPAVKMDGGPATRSVVPSPSVSTPAPLSSIPGGVPAQGSRGDFPAVVVDPSTLSGYAGGGPR